MAETGRDHELADWRVGDIARALDIIKHGGRWRKNIQSSSGSGAIASSVMMGRLQGRKMYRWVLASISPSVRGEDAK